MQQQSRTDFQSATDLLKHLIELTEPNEVTAQMGVESMGGGHLNVITEEEGEGIPDMAPPRVVENRNMMKQIHNEMRSDIEENGFGSSKTAMVADDSFATKIF